VPLEQAIRSSSGLSADILRLPERGYVKPAFCANAATTQQPAFYANTAT
jgi:hypothetical protein